MDASVSFGMLLGRDELSYAPRLAAHCWSAWELKAEIYLLLLVITLDTVFYHKVLQKVESWNDWPSFTPMFFEHSHKHLIVLTNLCKLIQAAPGQAIFEQYSHWCLEVQSGDLSTQNAEKKIHLHFPVVLSLNPPWCVASPQDITPSVTLACYL